MARLQGRTAPVTRSSTCGPRGTPEEAPGAQAVGAAASTPGALPRATVTVEFDAVQTAWLAAIAELHDCSRENVIREALSWFSAKESDRVQRSKRYAAIQLAARAEAFDPISDYLAGVEVVAP